MPELGSSPASDSTNELVQRWLAEFAPLVTEDKLPNAYEVRERLQLIVSLRQSGQKVRELLGKYSNDTPAQAQIAFADAWAQLDSIESDLRKYLGKLSPGDPESIADLQAIQEGLEARAARIEAGLPTHQEQPAFIRLKFPSSDLFSSGMPLTIAILGFGVLIAMVFAVQVLIFAGRDDISFVVILSVLLMLGLAQPWAYLLRKLSYEEVEIHGRQLTLRKKLGSVQIEEIAQLPSSPEATLLTENKPQSIFLSSTFQQLFDPTQTRITLTDAEGRMIKFGAGSDPIKLRDALNRINAYFKTSR